MSSDNSRRTNTTEQRNGVTVVNFVSRTVSEEWDIQMIGDDLFRLVDELGRRKVLLNFTNVEFMSSAALGKLITLHRKLQGVQGKLVIVGLADDIRETFRIGKLDLILTIVGTEAEAEAIFAAMPGPPGPAAAPQPDPVLTAEDIRQIEADGLTLGDAIRKVEALAE